MKTNNLKTPFIVSVLFHSVMLFSIAAYLPNVKKTVMDITPIEVLNILAEKETAPEPRLEKKEERHKPLPEKNVEKVEEIKKEIPPVEKQEEVKVQDIEIEPPPSPVEKATVVKNVEPPPLPKPVEDSSNIKAVETAKKTDTDIKTSEGISRLQESSSEAAAHHMTASVKPQEQAGSKYGIEGGTGKGTEDELKLFKTMIGAKIEKAKFYPMWAKKRDLEGVVGVKFTIQSDGSVNDVTVIKPCHSDVLNKAAGEAILKAAPFNPRPKDIENKEMAMEIDISFKLK